MKDLVEKIIKILAGLMGNLTPRVASTKEIKIWIFKCKVFLPKVHGTWILDKLTRNLNWISLSCFHQLLLYLNPLARLHMLPQIHTDAYSGYMRKSRINAMTINWTTWKETGMAYDNKFNIDTLFKAISNKKAINNYKEVLKYDMANVLLGEINFDGKIVKMMENYRLRLDSSILEKIKMVASSSNEKIRSKSKDGSVVLSGRVDGKYSETEKVLSRVCNEVLGFAEIDINENFFELGADSILVKEIFTRLDSIYPELVVTDIFEYPTIAKLAEYINMKQIKEDEVSKEREKYKQKVIKNIDENIDDMFRAFGDGQLSLDEARKNK